MLQCLKQTNDEVAVAETSPKTSPKEVLIEMVKANSKVTIREIAEAWGIAKRNAQVRINQYVKEGLLRRVGPARGGHWEWIENKH